MGGGCGTSPAHIAAVAAAVDDAAPRLPVERDRRTHFSGLKPFTIGQDTGFVMLGERAMTTFLNLIATEPEVARIPVMIDSSKWSVLEAGLWCVQGKGVVNSISLKEGEQPFLAQARRIRDHGAGVVVMAFDERGQADTTQRKVEICARAYDLLVQRAGFAPVDIIFDPKLLAVATSIPEHNGYARRSSTRCR